MGANRCTVTLAAQELQRAGLVQQRRGTVRVRDRAGLKAAACECYAVVREKIDRLLHAR